MKVVKQLCFVLFASCCNLVDQYKVTMIYSSTEKLHKNQGGSLSHLALSLYRTQSTQTVAPSTAEYLYHLNKINASFFLTLKFLK